MAPATPQPDFKLALRDLLRSGDVPHPVRQLAEELQMRMASPGEWAAAEHESPDVPENTDPLL